MKDGMITLGCKNITLFILVGIKSSEVWERQKEGNEWKLSHWPITSLLLTISRCIMFKTPLSSYSASRPGSTQLEARCGAFCWTLPQRGGGPTLAGALRDRPNLFWPQEETDSRLRLPVSHIGIYIYHFITLTHFSLITWQLPLILTSTFCVENLWLSARPRVHLQQKQILTNKKPERFQMKQIRCLLYFFCLMAYQFLWIFNAKAFNVGKQQWYC